MEIYPNFRRAWLYFIRLCIFTVMLGCQPNPTVQPSIYIVTKEEKGSQIWQLTDSDNSVSMLYEVVQSPERPVSVVFPSEEAKRLRSYLNVSSLPLLLTEPYIQDLRLSPHKEELGWLEGDVYCADGAAGCFGVYRLMIYDLDTGETKRLLQLPQHTGELSFRYYFPSQPTWSPNHQYIAMIGGFWSLQMETSLILVEANTGEVTEVVETVDSCGPLTWSGDSTSVAWVLSGRHNSTTGGGIRIYTLPTAMHKDIKLDGLWIHGWGMDWSPKDNRIVLSAENKVFDISDDREVKLYLLDSVTGNVQLVPVEMEGIFENPRWSPDGKLLAADFRPTITDLYTSLVVIEPNTGKIVQQLAMERTGRSWSWGADSVSILVHINVSTYKSEQEIGVFNVEDGLLRTLTLPEELTSKQAVEVTW